MGSALPGEATEELQPLVKRDAGSDTQMPCGHTIVVDIGHQSQIGPPSPALRGAGSGGPTCLPTSAPHVVLDEAGKRSARLICPLDCHGRIDPDIGRRLFFRQGYRSEIRRPGIHPHQRRINDQSLSGIIEGIGQLDVDGKIGQPRCLPNEERGEIQHAGHAHLQVHFGLQIHGKPETASE